jgi:hypothetical protein
LAAAHGGNLKIGGEYGRKKGNDAAEEVEEAGSDQDTSETTYPLNPMG